jgi:hypothetical protein
LYRPLPVYRPLPATKSDGLLAERRGTIRSDPESPRADAASLAKPTAEDFSARAIQRAVLAETVQHPLTILPAAVSGLSLLYMALISFDQQSFALAFGAALFGAAAWVVNYFFRGESFARARVAALRARREQYKEDELESLKARCATERFAEGARIAAGLAQAYDALHRLLSERAGAGDLNATRFLVLSEDTFEQALALLRSALESHRALREIDGRMLRHELDAATAERRALSGRNTATDADTEARIAALQTRIANYQKRLTLYEEGVRAVRHELAECDGLKAALETAYLEVIDLGREASPGTHGAAADKLATAVGAARRVDERLRASRDTGTEDQLYLNRGEKDSQGRA